MKKWRFPIYTYRFETGIDTSDMETFKKDPEGALAREICQNSIDAQLTKDTPVRVEFKMFEIKRDEIPGINELTVQIEKCYEYKKDSIKDKKPLQMIADSIKSNRIKCLRISDFNTTGLTGVSTNDISKPFFHLTKGSGISDKQGASGGSKGIGKFASFVISTTNTVFYSTRTIENEEGYIGISKLCSAPIEGDDDAVTQGIGYFSSNKKMYPIEGELSLDKSFKRSENQFGTDVYIIGFNDTNNWVGDIITKVLDSFMVAIIKNNFEVVVNDIILNKNTLNEVINSSEYFKGAGKKELKGIRAQYELLTEEGVSHRELGNDELGKFTVYVKSYNSYETDKATKQCVMIRYPYMKIKHTTGHSFLPYSAMCVIEDSNLNRKLREIENPQHTDWEIKRLNDYPKEKKEVRRLKNEFKKYISNYIEEVLSDSEVESTDIEGAGEFLPSQGEEGNIVGDATSIVDSVNITAIKMNEAVNPKTLKNGENGESYDISTGELVDGDPNGREMGNQNNKPNPNDNGKGEPNSEREKQVLEGNNQLLQRVPLSGQKFRTILLNRNESKYDIVFTSLYDENDCEIRIKQCGEGLDKYDVNIISASINGISCKVEYGKIVELAIQKNEKYKITCKIDIEEVFASEVILNAYR